MSLLCSNSLQDEIFQKFNLDTEWAVRLISSITNDEDIAIESNVVVKQVRFSSYSHAYACFVFGMTVIV